MLSNDLKLGAFVMSYKVTPKRINKIFDSRKRPQPVVPRALEPSQLKVAAVQLQARRYKNLEDYISHMETLTAKAVEGGAQMVCFPQYCGMLPITLLPAFDRILEELLHLEPDFKNLRDAFQLVVSTLSDFLLETYNALFSRLAKEFGVYVMAGSLYTWEKEQIHHRASLFDPFGELLGSQSKLIPSAFEEEYGITREQEIHVFHTLLGRVAILFEDDLRPFEPAKIARAMGAEILLCPCSSLPSDDLLWQSVLPILRAQEQSAYVVRSAMVGRLGISLQGDTGVYAPSAITSRGDGVLVSFPSDDQSGVVVGRTDLTRLPDGVDNYTGDSNALLYQDILLPLYDRQVQFPPAPPSAEAAEESFLSQLDLPDLTLDLDSILADMEKLATAPVTLPEEEPSPIGEPEKTGESAEASEDPR